MVEDCAVSFQPSSLAVALDILIKSCYVFNTEFPRSLSVMFGLLGSLVYIIKELKPTPKSQKLWTDICNVILFVKYL